MNYPEELLPPPKSPDPGFPVRVGKIEAFNPPWPERMPRRNSFVRS